MAVVEEFYDDIVAIGDGKTQIDDEAVKTNLAIYLGMSDDASVKLKKYFFAVMIHGWAAYLIPSNQNGTTWYKPDLIKKIHGYWLQKGKNRGILMISCIAGYLADDIARSLKLPVVGPQGLCRIDAGGQLVTELIPSDQGVGEGKKQWLICTPDGRIEPVSPHSALLKGMAVIKAKRWLNI